MNYAIIEAISQKRFLTQKEAEYADFEDPKKAPILWGKVDALYWVLSLLGEKDEDMKIERDLVKLTNKIYENGKKQGRKENEIEK